MREREEKDTERVQEFESIFYAHLKIKSIFRCQKKESIIGTELN